MGNYSYIENTEGCDLDVDAFIIAARKAIEDGELEAHYGETLNGFKDMVETFGDWSHILDGWKIQGYWYDSTVRFLYLLGEHMRNLSKTSGNDYVAMYEEQGFKFWIHFMLDDEDKVKLELEYMPMDIKTEYLARPASLKAK